MKLILDIYLYGGSWYLGISVFILVLTFTSPGGILPPLDIPSRWPARAALAALLIYLIIRGVIFLWDTADLTRKDTP